MRYTVRTFKVDLEVCDVGDRTAASDDAVRIARPIFAELDADKEHFVLLALNNKNRVNGYKVISTGTLTASLIRPGDVYRAALHLAAAAVVFVHNHPSGVMRSSGLCGVPAALKRMRRDARDSGARSCHFGR
jgi:hypothetical protein